MSERAMGGQPVAEPARALTPLVMMLAGRALFVIAQVVIARSTGPEGFGAFSLGWTVAGIGTLVGLLGLPHCCIRYGVSGRRVWTHGYMPIGIAFGLTCALAIYLNAGFLASEVFNAPASAGAIAGLAFSIPVNVALAIWSSAFKNDGQVAFGIFLTSAGLTLGPTVAVFGAWLLGRDDPTIYAWAYTIGLIPTVAQAILRPTRDRGEAVTLREKVRYGLQSWLTHGFGVVNFWIDRFIVGAFSTLAQLGQYQAASQLSMIPMLLAATATAVYEAPLARSNDRLDRGSVFLRAHLFQLHCTVAGCLAGMATASTWLEILFGSEFRAGGAALALLLFGQLVRSVGGPVISVLNLAGAPASALSITIASAVVNVLANLALVPSLGAVGAAAASCLASAILIAGGIWGCQRRRLLALELRHYRGVVISVAATLLAFLLVRGLAPTTIVGDVLLTGAMILAYFLPMMRRSMYAAEDEVAGWVESAVRIARGSAAG